MKKKREKRRKEVLQGFLLVIIIFLALLLIVYVAIPHLFRRFVLGPMTPEEKVLIKKFNEEPVEIPGEWQKVDPFPPQLLAAGDSFHEKWATATTSESYTEWGPISRRLLRGEALSEEESKVIEKAAAENRQLVAEITALGTIAGYEMEAFPSSDPDTILIGPDYLLFNYSIKALCLESCVLGREGKWDEAFDPCLTGFRLFVRHPASTLICHLVAYGSSRMLSCCVAYLAERCDDLETLRHTLNEMERLDAMVHLDALEDPCLVDTVGMLRSFARNGEEVDLSSGKPLRYYFRQQMELYGRRRGTDTDPVEPSDWEKMDRLPPLARSIEETLFKLFMPQVKEAQVNEKLAKSHYDLARLVLASRIEQIESGQIIQSVTAAVPKYFSVPPEDPFSGDAFPWSDNGQTFYSVGPDETDDSGLSIYDSSNGTISTGDVVLLPELSHATEN